MEGKAEPQRTYIMLLLRQKAVLARAQRIARHSEEAMQRLIPRPRNDADSGHPPNSRN